MSADADSDRGRTSETDIGGFHSIWKCHPIVTGVVLLSVAAGVYFRVARLDQRIFWFDECYTALKLSGHRGYVAAEQMLDGKVRTIAELRRYQRINPDRTWFNTLARCAGSDPQVGPLHCLILRIWAPIFGDSVAGLRAFSVLLGILCLPAIGWLAHEILQERGGLVPFIAISLMSLSPFEVIFSQEAREYALWTLITILSSATLLRAIRTGRISIWIAYGILTGIGLYSHLLHILVVLAQGIAAWRAARSGPPIIGWGSPVRRFALFGGAGVAMFIPWVLLMIVHARTAMESVAWTGILRRTIPGYIDRIGRHIARVALDFGVANPLGWQRGIEMIVIVSAVAAMVMVWRRIRHSPRRWAFELMFLLIVVPPALLGLGDLVRGGGIGMTVGRYVTPAYVGLILILACAIGWGLLDVSRSARATWTVGWVVFIVAAVYSCHRYSNSEYWWNKAASVLNPLTVQTIRGSARPLLIVELEGLNFGNLLALSHQLDPRTEFIGDPLMGFDLQGIDRILVYNPSSEFLQRLQVKFGMNAMPVEPAISGSGLYELRRRP